eukprot:COSAG01_NODE_4217_length_5230_cov_15.531280_4_plen_73_part_00
MAYLIGLVLNNWLALAWIMLVSSGVGLVSTFVLQETPVFLLLQVKPCPAPTQAALCLPRTSDLFFSLRLRVL